MHDLTGSLFLRWRWTPLEVIGLVVLGGGYAAGVLAAHRRGRRVAPARVVLWYLLGVLPFAAVTGNGWQRASHTALLPTLLTQTALLQVVPAGLGLGDPLGVLEAALGTNTTVHLERILAHPLMRVLGFPLVSAALSVVLMVTFVESPWLEAAAFHDTTNQLTGVVFLLVGMLFMVPILGGETSLVPTWCTAGIRVAIAAVDGVVDSVPPLLVMLATTPLWHPATTSDVAAVVHDQSLAGGVMFCLAELVGVPVLLGAAVQWVTSERIRSRHRDAELDAAEAAGTLDLKQQWREMAIHDITDPARGHDPRLP